MGGPRRWEWVDSDGAGTHVRHMSEEPKDPEKEPEKGAAEDPVEDLKKGVGLLFRAAKAAAQTAAHRAKDNVHSDRVEKVFKKGVDDLQQAIDRLQEDKLEGAIKTSLQEIGRAFGNVAQTIERELTKPSGSKTDPPPPPKDEPPKE
jgi:hypothetical protein